VNTGKYFVAFEPPPPTGELWGGFVMRERSKKYRLENPEKPRYVKYMYPIIRQLVVAAQTLQNIYLYSLHFLLI
jgi:hypothetical protein